MIVQSVTRAAVLLFALGASQAAAGIAIPLPLNVFGVDDRVRIAALESSPFRQTVKIFAGGSGCSGALVGPDVVVTAHHCVDQSIRTETDSEGNRIHRIIAEKRPRVYVGYNEGKSDAKSEVIHIHFSSSVDDDGDYVSERDWAILVTRDRLGDRFGYLGFYHYFPTHHYDRDLILPGYPGDLDDGKRMHAVFGCHARSHNGARHRRGGNTWYNRIKHDCDMHPGNSGSPIVDCRDGSCLLVAVNVSQLALEDDEAVTGTGEGDSPRVITEYRDDGANYAVNVGQFSSILKKYRDRSHLPPEDRMSE